LLFQKGISLPQKNIISILVLIAGFFAVDRILVAMHVEEYSLSALREFSAGQLAFLRGFGAGSELPMEDYTWPQKLWAVFFRPFWMDIKDFWDVAAVLENSISLLLWVVLLVGFLYSWKNKLLLGFPPVFYAGLILAVLMMLVFALTLNNLGIMMRMKSTYTLFCYLPAWRVIYLMNKSYHCNG
jgi:hypothetical protein